MSGRAASSPTAGALSAMRHVSVPRLVAARLTMPALKLYVFGVGDQFGVSTCRASVSQRMYTCVLRWPRPRTCVSGWWAKFGR